VKLQQSQDTKFPQSTAPLIVRCCLKFRFCQFTRCPYELKENVFRRKPLTRDKFSGKGGA